MSGEPTITVIGNLTDDPELRFTPSGAAVARFRIASTPRHLDRQSNEWRDGEPLFLSCSIWRQAAENAAESLSRGSRVIVTGRLRQRTYETREGNKRTVIELEADEIGPSLRSATATVRKMDRAAGHTAAGDSQRPTRTAASDDDPWSVASPAGAAGHTGSDDEPPF
ncbi:single-stranded DNA-binding protein [Asanoa ishikariensis]|uniref:Single-stranded DNA-binding protein n=1 Tax=Asanoa ishikariensis TaxID=137265 RepID=A0A1H3RWG5_9ACTN|nr:single-stranded DNA-binding protein [Asanoa ishikariensis]GIF66751.1 single-stranded DNA-binding protein [Asanoa ishikariensis]SDZ29990.1 single-strand DNA-binding protein [Asanoa ishikariensis]